MTTKTPLNKAVSPLISGLLARSAAKHADTKAALPFVSVITPTWERRTFLPYLIYMFQYQDYPADRRELVILDDSARSSQDLVDQINRTQNRDNPIRYYYVSEHLDLGEKRNRLNELAQGEYIICMDDDDYYPPDKISYTIGEMQRHNALFAGCDQIPIWYSHIDRIYKTQAFGTHHALNGTFAYHRNFLKKHRYDDSANLGEEEGFLNGFTAPVLQLDPMRSILCVSHSSNTFDKDFLMGQCEAVDATLSAIVGDGLLRKHYQRLSQAPVRSIINWGFFSRIVVNPLSGNDATREAFCQTLLSLGVSPQQLEIWPAGPAGEPLAASHKAVAEKARAENWPNYLLLDDRLSLVRQEKTVANINRMLQAMEQLEWSVSLLGCNLHRLHLLKSLPGTVRALEAGQAVAYAVNQPYYGQLIDNLSQGLIGLQQQPDNPDFALDFHWQSLMQTGLWLALYPGFAYRREGDNGEDLTAGFFRKVQAG